MVFFARARQAFFTLSFVALLLCALAPAAVAADSTVYTDPYGAYSFTLPDGWQGPQTSDAGILFQDSVNRTALIITSVPTGGLSLDDLNTAFTSTFPQQPGYVMDPGGVKDLTIGGQPAKGSSFHSNNTDGSPISTAVLTVVNNGTAYLLLFLTTPDKEDASSPGVGMIVSSWKFS